MKVILLALVLVLAACGSSNSQQSSKGSVDSKTSSEQNNAKQRTPTLFDAQIDSMGKAENVEDTVLKAEQARREQMQDL